MKNLSSFNGIRALATISIFLFHAGFLPKGNFAVELFFMLSGFLMYYTKSDLVSLEEGKSFFSWNKIYVKKKLKQFYPIHCITLIIAILISNQAFNLNKVVSLILNVTLLQSFVSEYAMSFNGLAWYLSVTIILYVFSYLFIKFVNRTNMLVGCICCIVLMLSIDTANVIGDFNLYLYSNPLFRCLDFLLGMYISKIFINKEALFNNSKKYTIVEIACCGVFLVQYILSQFIEIGCVYYCVIFAAMLFVFSYSGGFISNLMDNKILKVISKYSFEFYMVHELALRIFRFLFNSIEINYLIKIIMISVPALICSVVFVMVLTFVRKKIYEKRSRSTV